MPDSSANTRILQLALNTTPTATDPTLIHALLHTTFLNPEVLMEGQCTYTRLFVDSGNYTAIWNMSNTGWRLTVLIMSGHQHQVATAENCITKPASYTSRCIIHITIMSMGQQ